jgi:hypothetical protein
MFFRLDSTCQHSTDALCWKCRMFTNVLWRWWLLHSVEWVHVIYSVLPYWIYAFSDLLNSPVYEFPALALSITLLIACIMEVSFHCKINYYKNVSNISLHSENRQYRDVALWTMTHCPFTICFLCIFTNCWHKKVNFFLIHALLAQINFNKPMWLSL